jgi:hypothetical protein
VMKPLSLEDQTFHWDGADTIVAGLWNNDGVRHYAAFQRVVNVAPVAGSL